MKHRLLIFLFFLLQLIVYTPYVIQGGFGVGDDLADLVSVSKTKDDFELIDALTYYKDRMWISSRAVSLTILGIVLYLYKDVAMLYICSHMVVWLLNIFFLFYIIKKTLDSNTAWIFAVLCSFPIFSSTVVFESIFFESLDMSIMFWSLSMCLLYKYIINNRIYNYLLGYLFLLLGLLSYELILPLLIVTALLPIIYKNKLDDNLQDDSNIMTLSVKFVTPVTIIAALFFIYKTYGIKILSGNPLSYAYGLAPIGLKSILQACYFYVTLLVEIPLLLIEVLPRLFEWQILLAVVVIVIFFIVLKKYSKEHEIVVHVNPSHDKYFIMLVLGSLIACSSIFFLSSYPSVTFGFYNRMLHSSLVLICILLGWAFSKTLHSRLIIITIIITILWTASMIVQLNNFINSWEIRKKVYQDIVVKLNNTDLGEDPFVIANVPYYTKNNYNNEEVFFLTWDFSAGLRMFGLNKDVESFPVCWRSVVDNTYNPAHNINTFIAESTSRLRKANIWYYEYWDKPESSKLEKINGMPGLFKKFHEIEKNKINYHPIIIREKIRLYLKNRVLNLQL